VRCALPAATRPVPAARRRGLTPLLARLRPCPAWLCRPAACRILRKKIQPPPLAGGAIRPQPYQEMSNLGRDSRSALRYGCLAFIITMKRDAAMAEGDQEKRREAGRKAAATRGREERSEASRKAAAAKSPEARREAGRKAAATRSPEARREAGLKGAAKRSREERSETSRKAAAAKSPEQRRQVALKAAATRKRNREAKTSVGGAPGL
jgi:hypothetical protein